MGTTIRTGTREIYVEHRGEGPDVLLVAGLGDPVEAWQAQIDGLARDHHVIAYDNRGTGRTPLGDEPLSVPAMAEDAVAVLRALDVPVAHVVGFSGGSVIAQELALREPELVRSLVLVSTWARPDAYFRAMLSSWRWMAERAPDERAFLESFFVWVYTHRAHETGLVRELVEETLAFPHPTSLEAIQQTIDALLAHQTIDRLADVASPTLVLAGGRDLITPPGYGRLVADLIPGARFEVLPEEAHQPFQEVPEKFNARVDAFWKEVGRRDVLDVLRASVAGRRSRVDDAVEPGGRHAGVARQLVPDLRGADALG